MCTVLLEGHNVPEAALETVQRLLSFAADHGLEADSTLASGWSIRRAGRSVFQIQVDQPKQRDIVIQLRHMRTWVSEPALQDLRQQLHELITDPEPDFPAISFARLREPNAIDRFI